MPFNAKNPYSLVSQVIRDPMLRLIPARNSVMPVPLTPDECQRIFDLYKAGKTQVEIGEDLGRSSSIVGVQLRRMGVVVDPRRRRVAHD